MEPELEYIQNYNKINNKSKYQEQSYKQLYENGCD